MARLFRLQLSLRLLIEFITVTHKTAFEDVTHNVKMKEDCLNFHLALVRLLNIFQLPTKLLYFDCYPQLLKILDFLNCNLVSIDLLVL